MFPCCHFCYESYINADGELDSVRLKKLREARLKEAIERGENGLLVARLSKPFTDDRPPCMCDCHRDGKNVLH